MYNLIKKTSMVKNHAKKWNKTTYGNIFKQLDEIENSLLALQTKDVFVPAMSQIKKQNNLIKKEAILVFHKKYWGQRAKVKHIRLLDTNSGYFHKVATGKRKRKIIREITTIEGTIILGLENIRSEIKRHFEKRFKKTEH